MPLKKFLQALDWFSNDARRRVKSRRREQTNSWRLEALEALEDRHLLASVVLAAGNVSVTGTLLQNESLTVSNSGATIRLNDANHPLTAGAGFTRIDANTVSFPASALTGTFTVDLGSGTDAITFAPNTLVAARLGMTLKSESITVGAGATLSTRAATGNLLTANSTANSGNITVEGEQITVGVGGRLLSHVQAGSAFSPGSITVTANVDKIIRTLAITPPAANVSITNALIKGGDVSITAHAQDRFGVVGFKKEATANVTVDGSTIDAATLELDSTADTSITSLALMPKTTGAFSFTAIPNQRHTITRTSGNWLTEGFLPGQSILVEGTTSNDGNYLIALVTPTTITLADGYEVATETAPAATITGDLVLPDLETILELKFPFTRSAIVTLSKADANVSVTGNSVLTTSGDVTITSSSDSTATPFFLGLGTSLFAQVLGAARVFEISAVWADSDARANASVEGTTRITAGGKVLLNAETVNTVTADTSSSATNTPIGLTFAGAITKADTDAFLAAGTVVTAASIDVLATTETDVQVGAAVLINGGSGVGLGVAYNDLKTDTDAYIAGTVNSSGAINVLATVLTENFLTAADTRHSGSTKVADNQIPNNFNGFGRDAANSFLHITPGDDETLKARFIN